MLLKQTSVFEMTCATVKRLLNPILIIKPMKSP